MKKLFLMSIAIVLTVLICCRSDDDSDSNQLVLNGSWRPDKIMTTITANGGTTTSSVVTNDCQQKGRINTAGNFKYYDIVNGTCSVIIELDIAYNRASGDFPITTNGNKVYGAVTILINSNMRVYYVDKSNPESTNRVEISASKVAN